MIRSATFLLLIALAGCTDRDAPPGRAGAQPPAPPATPTWRLNPSGAGLTVTDGTLLITTGPHVIAWDPAAPALRPPYTLSATFHKRTGRLHEGIGLLFGGSGLDGAETAQDYSYFLVRGDGSYLIKRRQGAGTPVVRDWTLHPAIRRDADGSGRPNQLQVAVGDSVAVFRVNGAEVARVPVAQLSVSGAVGVRVAHDLELEVSGFQVEPGS